MSKCGLGRQVVAASILAFAAVSNSVCAQTEDAGRFGIGLKGGTLGAGVELDYRFNDYFNARLQANGLNYEDEFEEDDIDYTGELELSTYGLLLDWRPFAGTFRVSGGIYANGNKAQGRAASYGDEIFEIGDQEYVGSSSDPLRLNAQVELGSGSAGYLGLGWGNSPSANWMFSFEIGVLFSGSPEVSLDVAGTAALASDPSQTFDIAGNSAEAVELRANIDQEVRNLEDDISDFDIYPVISLGIGYRF